MNVSCLSATEALAIYNAIFGSDVDFITAMAKAAITSANDIMVDMHLEQDAPGTPDQNDVRGQAVGFTKDVLIEFGRALEERINTIPFEYRAKVVQALDTKLIF